MDHLQAMHDFFPQKLLSKKKKPSFVTFLKKFQNNLSTSMAWFAQGQKKRWLSTTKFNMQGKLLESSTGKWIHIPLLRTVVIVVIVQT